MDILQLLESSRSYDELLTTLKYSGFVCIESLVSDLVLIYCSDLPKGSRYPTCGGKSFQFIVISRTGLNVVTIGMPQILVNDYCAITEACIRREELHFTELYDARYITIFYYKGQWWTVTDFTWDLSTVKCCGGCTLQNLWDQVLPDGFYCSFR